MSKRVFLYFRQKYKDSRFIAILSIFNTAITDGTFISYPVLLLYLLWKSTALLPFYIIIPGISFVLLSLFRRVVNRKRPYEEWKTEPLIPRDKSGKSFPSRHVFSIFLIAVLWYRIFPAIGIILFIAGIFLAAIRVITGIHYISDVLAGAIIGVLVGILTVFLTF